MVGKTESRGEIDGRGTGKLFRDTPSEPTNKPSDVSSHSSDPKQPGNHQNRKPDNFKNKHNKTPSSLFGEKTGEETINGNNNDRNNKSRNNAGNKTQHNKTPSSLDESSILQNIVLIVFVAVN